MPCGWGQQWFLNEFDLYSTRCLLLFLVVSWNNLKDCCTKIRQRVKSLLVIFSVGLASLGQQTVCIRLELLGGGLKLLGRTELLLDELEID